MGRSATLLAFDLGASSGRAIIGRLRDGKISISEIHRFRNDPVQYNGELHWDMARIWSEMQFALSSLGSHAVDCLDSLGVDTWGVDYALLGEHGVLLENPYHYRDRRTEGVMERVLELLTRERVYDVTGIQFMPINTLYQLYAAARRTPKLLAAARSLVMIPDLLNFWLSGIVACEYTNATTTQFLNHRTGDWCGELLRGLGIPTHMLVPIIQPGTVIGGLVSNLARQVGLGAPSVVAPASHDTGSAVAAVRCSGRRAFLSSGTWSLLGTEVTAPVVTPEAQQMNFTNEGGVCGTIRLLKNITGLWLIEGCRRAWEKNGGSWDWVELLEMSAAEEPFRHLVDPDDALFVRPDDMTKAIDEYCRRTAQLVPSGPAAYVRAVLESLALKYRIVLEQLESLCGVRFEEIRVIGGGSQNAMLDQFTADATGRKVLAGPSEATALGNLAMQMVATGAIASIDNARDLIEQSFPTRLFRPVDTEKWDGAYSRLLDYCRGGSVPQASTPGLPQASQNVAQGGAQRRLGNAGDSLDG